MRPRAPVTATSIGCVSQPPDGRDGPRSRSRTSAARGSRRPSAARAAPDRPPRPARGRSGPAAGRRRSVRGPPRRHPRTDAVPRCRQGWSTRGATPASTAAAAVPTPSSWVVPTSTPTPATAAKSATRSAGVRPGPDVGRDVQDVHAAMAHDQPRVRGRHHVLGVGPAALAGERQHPVEIVPAGGALHQLWICDLRQGPRPGQRRPPVESVREVERLDAAVGEASPNPARKARSAARSPPV